METGRHDPRAAGLALSPRRPHTPRVPTLGPRQRLVLLLLAAAIGAGARVEILARETPALLLEHGSDDLFYFTETARHVARGEGLTFDGEHATTGVQPLWMALLVPLAPLYERRPEVALRVDLAVVTLLTLLVGLLLPWALRRVLTRRAGLPEALAATLGTFAGCAWLVHPRVLGATFEGTEGALAALCWTLSLGAWAAEDGSARSQLRAGLALGLGTLARVDHAVLALCLALVAPGPCRPRARRAALIASSFALVVAPWVGFCLATTGTPMAESGVAKRLVHERQFNVDVTGTSDDPGPVGHPAARVVRFATGLRTLAGAQLFRSGTRWSRTNLAGLALVFGFALAASRRGRAGLRAAFPSLHATTRALWPWLGAAFLLPPLYVAWLHHARMWYLVPPILASIVIGAALLGDLVSALVTRLPSRPARLAATLTLALWLGTAHLEEALAHRTTWHPVYLDAARRIASTLPQGARIGAFNAGMQGAFAAAAGRVVINLDGVVNHEALVALRTRSLAAYLDDAHIDYVIDHDRSIAFFETIGAPGLGDRLERLDAIAIEGRPEATIGIWRLRR